MNLPAEWSVLPPEMRNTRRRGVTLVQILLFVAFDAWALLFLMVSPFFQDHCCGGSYYSRAAQDIEIIKKAISLYDAREEKPLSGTSLEPLLGRYMQELPPDPWGRAYLFDAELGVIASFGRDGCPSASREGPSQDWDRFVRTRPRPDLDDEALLRELAARAGIACETGWLADDGPRRVRH